MARFTEPTPEQERGWNEWVADRPENVRKIAENFEPWSLYRMSPNGERVTVYSFSEEDGGRVTLTVDITSEFNLTLFERRVFGVDPDNLSPCELPDASEATGTLMSAEDVAENIDELRAMIRPDLWEVGTDGVAHRKNN